MQAERKARHRDTPLDGVIRAHIDDARAALQTLIATQGHRFHGLSRLESQFDSAISSYRRHGRREVRGVIERVNELCVARCLVADPALADAELRYEPDLLKDGPRFDVVATTPDGTTHAIEIKTISPMAAIASAVSWIPPPPYRRALRPSQTEIMAAADAAFQRHADVTAQKAVRLSVVGHGSVVHMIVCGDGSSWTLTDTEVFASRALRQPLSYGIMLRRPPDLEPTTWISPLPPSATGLANPS